MYVWSSNEIMSATIFLDLPHIAKGILWLLQIVRKICCMYNEKGEKKVENGVGRFYYATTSLLFFLRCIPWKLLILICTSLSRSSVVVYWSVCGIAVEMDRITYFVEKLIQFFQTFTPWKKSTNKRWTFLIFLRQKKVHKEWLFLKFVNCSVHFTLF